MSMNITRLTTYWTVDEAEVEWVHTSSVRGYHRVPVRF